MANIILDRLEQLRELMDREGVDYALFTTADFHNSEYVNDYFKVREFFSGFTGSNGDLLVWKDGAGLWTDGRYFIQAENELMGSSITLYKSMQPGVPTISDFLKANMKPGEVLGFDGRCITTSMGKNFEKKLEGITIKYDFVPGDFIWTDRPKFPCGKAYVISDDIAGKSIKQKLFEVREQIKKEGAESLFITKLDDIMWLFNIRGCDVECNPVAMSYAYIAMDVCAIFIQDDALSAEVFRALDKNGVIVSRYDAVSEFMEYLYVNKKVIADERHCSYSVFKMLNSHNSTINAKNPTELLKSIKNPVEIERMKDIYLKDSVALTKFIYWLKTNIGKEEITEISASDKLLEFRKQIPEFIDLSFPTIAGYKANAAMMHYEATKDNFAVLKPEGMLLVDSGGQYFGGTTDVTRTIVLGEISEEIKKQYTLVAAGMLDLANAHWLYGCTGRNLDILARKPLWNIDIDYQCGTGHGVGYILNVHEGPQNMRWKFLPTMTEAVIEAGMDITDEPGVYVEGSHGIRIENVLIAVNDTFNQYGQFMHFDMLTFAPIDMEAIDLKYLSGEEIGYLKSYQEAVYEKVAPFLTNEEAEWLRKETTVA